MMLPAAGCVPLRRIREFACKAVVCTEAVRSETRRFFWTVPDFSWVYRACGCVGGIICQISGAPDQFSKVVISRSGEIFACTATMAVEAQKG